MCVFPCFSQAQQSPRKKASKAAAASSVMDLAHLLKFCEDSKLLDTARGMLCARTPCPASSHARRRTVGRRPEANGYMSLARFVDKLHQEIQESAKVSI